VALRDGLQPVFVLLSRAPVNAASMAVECVRRRRVVVGGEVAPTGRLADAEVMSCVQVGGQRRFRARGAAGLRS
jgi:hypothetical protein